MKKLLFSFSLFLTLSYCTAQQIVCPNVGTSFQARVGQGEYQWNIFSRENNALVDNGVATSIVQLNANVSGASSNSLTFTQPGRFKVGGYVQLQIGLKEQ
jgi:hypothetical protein